MRAVGYHRSSFRKKIFCFSVSIVICGLCSSASPQTTKIRRIGIINNSEPSVSMDTFRQMLQDLGYIPGKNIAFEYRYTEGNRERIPGFVSELVGLKVDILFSTQAIVIRAAKQATKTIPIVMAITPDPVEIGLVDNMARPGANITGVTFLTRNLSGKRLEVLAEIIPRLSRVGILGIAGFTTYKDYQEAAREMKIALQRLDIRVANPDLQTPFQIAVKDHAGAIIVLSVPGLSSYRKEIIKLALHNRLPLMAESPLVVDDGALASYDTRRDEMLKRAAIYIDKILKGANRATLAIETPTKFELVINLKTAKQIGLVVPPNVLARADRVIR